MKDTGGDGSGQSVAGQWCQTQRYIMSKSANVINAFPK